MSGTRLSSGLRWSGDVSSFAVPSQWPPVNSDMEEEEEDDTTHLRPVCGLTLDLKSTFETVNPSFVYKPKYQQQPRILTQPNVPRHNDGQDNENCDLIVRVDDVLGSDLAGNQQSLCWLSGSKYKVIEMLGQGTFGQVFKCRDLRTKKLVALKVLKSKPAYFKQGLLEIGILQAMNTNADPLGDKHTLRFLDHFMYQNHLCLSTGLLSINLYELMKQNQFHGLSLNLVRRFTTQILTALASMEEAEIIHCDLKPENILMESMQGSDVSLIDFGSGCFEGSTMYSYIQSRHYRCPEVILGLQYTCAIDMWSLGCITAELVLGIPIFPGSSEYDELYRIVTMVGMPPDEMIELGTKGAKYFRRDYTGRSSYILKSVEEFERESGRRIEPHRRYYDYRTLEEFTARHTLRGLDRGTGTSPSISEAETRRSLLHFLRGCLQLNPTTRWTPQQALLHPFLAGKPVPDSGWVPPPPRRPPQPLRAPLPKDSSSGSSGSSSRTPIVMPAVYDKFLSDLRDGRVTDGLSRTVLAQLRSPLVPAPSTGISGGPTTVKTRGNRSSSFSDVRQSVPLPSVGSSITIPPPLPSSTAASMQVPSGQTAKRRESSGGNGSSSSSSSSSSSRGGRWRGSGSGGKSVHRAGKRSGGGTGGEDGPGSGDGVSQSYGAISYEMERRRRQNAGGFMGGGKPLSVSGGSMNDGGVPIDLGESYGVNSAQKYSGEAGRRRLGQHAQQQQQQGQPQQPLLFGQYH